MSGPSIDMRGRPCPEPVVATRKAIAAADVDEVTIIVDNRDSASNVSRMAASLGWAASTQEAGDREYRVRLSRGGGPPGEQPAPHGQASCSTSPWVAVLIASDRFGEGDAELGRKLMGGFIRTLRELPHKPETVIFINAGVNFVTDDSPVLEALEELAGNGIQILACGTCLDHFGLRDRVGVGNVSNMLEIASILASADRVVRP